MDEDKSIFTPEDFIRYEASCRNVDLKQFRCPNRMIVLYSSHAFEYASQILDRKADWLYGSSRPIYTGIANNTDVGVFRLLEGAPAAAGMLEELITCGTKHVIEVGVAGSLHSSLTPGDFVVVTGAFRDEGTSNHYFSPEIRLTTSPILNNLLLQHFKQTELSYQMGPVWTTDGIYRETRSKFLKFRKCGALVVNMETSALLAVAKYRQIELASIQVISDVLSEKGWKPAFRHKHVLDGVRVALDVAIEILADV